MLCDGKILLLLAVVATTITVASNAKNSKRKKNYRSTSSESGQTASGSDADSGDKESLELSGLSQSAETQQDKKRTTFHMPGWRKWHRKCVPCPAEMAMKYTHRKLQWVCGGYQRARRTFKSACMMHFRNCQDGTMFVKIHNGFCNRSSTREGIGEHFFYDYSDSSDSERGSGGSDESD